MVMALLPFAALDDELGRTLAGNPRAAPRKAGQHRAVPQPDRAFAKQPLAVDLDEPVVVVAGESQRVGRLSPRHSVTKANDFTAQRWLSPSTIDWLTWCCL